MATTTELNIREGIRFFGSLVGTVGLSEENNNIANNYVERLLKAHETFITDYEEEVKEGIEFREAEKKRLAEEPQHIIAPSSFDMNNLNIS